MTAIHAGNWTMVAAGDGTIACDLEPVAARPDATWRGMLGPDRWELAGLISQRTGEPATQAVTRVWVASECLTKAGMSSGAPLVLAWTTSEGGTVVLSSGTFQIVTLALPAGPEPDRPPMIVGLLGRSGDATV